MCFFLKLKENVRKPRQNSQEQKAKNVHRIGDFVAVVALLLSCSLAFPFLGLLPPRGGDLLDVQFGNCLLDSMSTPTAAREPFGQEF